jgi:hypothetical protein
VGLPAPSRERPTKKLKKLKIKIFYLFILILFSYYFCWSFRLNPAELHGVKPWEPPHLLPPNSYLLPLLLHKTPHESYFFALTFGKPLNYFTCEKEDF